MTLTVRPRTIFKTKRHNMGLMSEHVEHGFGPVWDGESRALILGSMPSPKSRAAAFYYMHPQNRFWPAHIFATGAKSAQLYRKLIEPRLTEAGIAIGMTQLPSTSPANASMRLPDLITAYREAFQKANVLENAYWKN